MEPEDILLLAREVNAVQIPSGNQTALKKGTPVTITQSLGGSYTVHVNELAGLFRISSADADALGIESSNTPLESPDAGEFSEDRVWEVLKTCYDPEIPVNIVDLGLIYSLDSNKDDQGKHLVNVKMTLTAPGCGMGPSIAADARSKIISLKGVRDAQVDVVWEPPWNPSMISPAGKEKLGIDS